MRRAVGKLQVYTMPCCYCCAPDNMLDRHGPHGLWFLTPWIVVASTCLEHHCYYSELYPDDLSPSVANCCHQFHFCTVSFWMFVICSNSSQPCADSVYQTLLQGGSDGTAQGCCGRRKSAKHQFGGGKGWWTISCSKFPRWKCKKKTPFTTRTSTGFFCCEKKTRLPGRLETNRGRKPWQQTMNEWHTTKRSGPWASETARFLATFGRSQLVLATIFQWRGALNSNRFPQKIVMG